MKCRYCGAEIPDDSAFCPNCGKKIENVRHCVKCGEMIEDDAKFCPHCGAEQPAYIEDSKNNKKWFVMAAVICIAAVAAFGSFFFLNRGHGGGALNIVNKVSRTVKSKTHSREIKVRTLVMEEGQPPVVGGAVDKECLDNIKLSGVAFSSEQAHLEVSASMDFQPFDESGDEPSEDFYFGGEPSQQWAAFVMHLSHGGLYYARAFVITKDDKIIYGGIQTVNVTDFIRSSDACDYANVWHANDCTLFDLETDEIIPSTYYYSTNERPDQMGQGQKGQYNTCYKFIDEYGYHHWRQRKDEILLNKPMISYHNGKITIDSAYYTYYSINTHHNPSMFNFYTGPFEVPRGSTVFCYASDGNGHVSDIACYYVE